MFIVPQAPLALTPLAQEQRLITSILQSEPLHPHFRPDQPRNWWFLTRIWKFVARSRSEGLSVKGPATWSREEKGCSEKERIMRGRRVTRNGPTYDYRIFPPWGCAFAGDDARDSGRRRGPRRHHPASQPTHSISHPATLTAPTTSSEETCHFSFLFFNLVFLPSTFSVSPCAYSLSPLLSSSAMNSSFSLPRLVSSSKNQLR